MTRHRSRREIKAIYAKSRNPRMVLGEGRVKVGRKCRVRYPAMTSGYITNTYVSIAEAKRDIDKLNHWQKRKAKITKL